MTSFDGNARGDGGILREKEANLTVQQKPMFKVNLMAMYICL